MELIPNWEFSCFALRLQRGAYEESGKRIWNDKWYSEIVVASIDTDRLLVTGNVILSQEEPKLVVTKTNSFFVLSLDRGK